MPRETKGSKRKPKEAESSPPPSSKSDPATMAQAAAAYGAQLRAFAADKAKEAATVVATAVVAIAIVAASCVVGCALPVAQAPAAQAQQASPMTQTTEQKTAVGNTKSICRPATTTAPAADRTGD